MLPILRSSRARCILAVVFASSLLPSLQAQSTEADIKAKLKDKPLYLRGFWREDDLHFNSTGQLIGKSGTVTFTICGFGLKAIDRKPDKLILEGTRVGLELSGDRQKRVSPNKHMHIEIAASPNGDYGPALDAIFADGLDKLVPSLHSYWKSYAEKNFLPASVTKPLATPANSDSKLGDTNVKKIGGTVSPPKLLNSIEPKINQIAHSQSYGGHVLVNLHVEPDGTISHPVIIRALGLGLDEDALVAILRYAFMPAMQDGEPVLFELNVDVNFQAY